jgi:tRNA(Ile)-lysidine synthase
LHLTALAGKPRALWRRALHRWLLAQRKAGDVSRQAFDLLLAAAERGKATRHSLGREGFAVTDGRFLWFEKAGKIHPISRGAPIDFSHRNIHVSPSVQKVNVRTR